jgi:type I restriction enzyme R subunit
MPREKKTAKLNGHGARVSLRPLPTGRTATRIPPRSREERATQAKVAIGTEFNAKQCAFLDFVLAQYAKVGVEELDREKLSPLLKLKYNAIADAVADLGRPEEIGSIFAGFQKYLYQQSA